MKFLMCIAFVLCLVAAAQAAVARTNLSHPAHPGKCVIDAKNVISPGQVTKAPNHHCASVTCMENGHAVFHTCPAVAPPKGCKLRDFVNVDRNYPECCERTHDCTRHF